MLVVSPMVVHRHAGFPVDTGYSGVGDFLLGRPKVPRELAGFCESLHTRSARPDPIVDDNIGLKASDVVVEFGSIFRVPSRFPLTVKPEDADLPVIRQELFQLVFQVLEVPIEICSGGRTVLLPLSPGQIIRMMPVHNGMVPADLYPLFVTGVRQFLQDIAFERCRHDIKISVLESNRQNPS